jgi:hypothetical protein
MLKRELKFRVYNKEKGCWIKEHIDYVPEKPMFKENYIIQEFTGLKDDENIEIYEGDILEIVWANRKLKTEVKFHYGAFITEYTTPEDAESFHWLHSIQMYACPKKVVGNIFQRQD